MALITDELRSATIAVATKTAILLKLTRETLQEIMASSNAISYGVQLSIAKAAVNAHELFTVMPQSSRDTMFNHLTQTKYVSGSIICRQGAIANNFFILTEGSCGISILNSDQEGAKDVILNRRLYPGDVFGKQLHTPCTFSLLRRCRGKLHEIP